ncbi:hypothetical protein C621_0212130 [Bacillus thuringiensis serovar aizawai str. Leapi01]|nr:hypothetical protein C621_0212130 [Bacillus thuringiensis serovar aizawai str. Leapi01]ETE96720.1 hypothetical protein C623_0218270 [Bacillus thuringiensis serovar aizawai str. Hu4-2]
MKKTTNLVKDTLMSVFFVILKMAYFISIQKIKRVHDLLYIVGGGLFQ